ncbi:hypothetical protein EA061_20515, partial [Salmonella enterica subsp. enterica serovar Oranienburg]|nr:hypothetical protein [Salmonella enterica]MMT23788.1 hypothetical protein [Salmonella enterica subsp. enterica serovar Oranienburg]
MVVFISRLKLTLSVVLCLVRLCGVMRINGNLFYLYRKMNRIRVIRLTVVVFLMILVIPETRVAVV